MMEFNKVNNFLFVCSSNVCRSPYAEFVFRRMVEDSEKLKGKGVSVRSAAVVNRCVELHPKTKRALLALGFDEKEVDAHKPSFVRDDKTRFEQADVIIGMTYFHKWFVPKEYRAKFITLSEAATEGYKAIPDPFLIRKQEKYNKVLSVIDDYLALLAKKAE